MPTDVSATVRVNGGGNYTSLSAAEAGLQRNLVSNDQTMHILCEQGVDTTAVTIAGWTTDNSHYLHIYTQAAQPAVWDDNRYTLSVTDNDAINIQQNYCSVQRLQIQVTGTNTGLRGAVNVSSASLCFICDNKMKRLGSQSSYRRGYAITARAGSRVYNNIIWGWDYGSSSARGIYGLCSTAHDGIYCMGNLVHSCYMGFSFAGADGYYECFNNIAVGCTDGYSNRTGVNEYNGYNISDIANDAPGEYSATGTPSFKDSANGDYRLTAADTLARNKANSVVHNYWGIDHLMTSRQENNEGAYDIGPFEFHPTIMVVQECSLAVSSESPQFTQVHVIDIRSCDVETSSDGLSITQLHIIDIDSCGIATSSDEPETDVSIVAEAARCDVETSSDAVAGVLEIRQFYPVDGTLRTSSDSFKITQQHTLVVNDSTLPVASESPDPDFQLVFVGIADCTLATSSDEPTIDRAHVFEIHDCWVFTANTRVYPFNLVQTFSSKKTTATPDFKEVVVLNDQKSSVLMSDLREAVPAVDLYA